MTDLPEGWCRTTLENVADWSSGGTPSRSKSEYFNGGIPWIKTGELVSKYIHKTEETLSELGVAKSSAKVFPKGSVGIAMYGATIGKVSIWGIAASTNQACAVAQPIPGIALPEFLYHFLKSEKEALVKKGKGGAQPNISQGLLKEWSIALPPFNEQRRIVEKIEALFAEIDAGVESLRTARVKLGLYRQSLLKSAFEGRLTADWRARNADKLEAPEALLARIQSERDTRYKAALDNWETALTNWRANGEQGKKPAKPKRPEVVPSVKPSETTDIGCIPMDWAWVRPSLIADPTPYSIGIGPFGSNLKVPDYRDEGVPLVFVRNLTKEDFSLNRKYVTTEKAKELEAHSIQGGDVLVTKMGDPPGDCTVYPDNGPYAIITADCLKFRVWRNFANRHFVAYMIRCNSVRRQLGLITQGVAQKKISVARFKTITLPLPNLAEQTEIVRILDEKLSAADAMEAEIDAALTRADALRQSILKKAFSGKLIPQDPTDEPASTLLARIQATRAAAPKAKRTRKTPA